MDGEQANLPKIMTVKEVAAYLRLHPNTVRRYVADGLIRCVTSGKYGRKIITDEAVREFLRSSASSAT